MAQGTPESLPTKEQCLNPGLRREGGTPSSSADHRDGEALASGRTIRKRGRVIGSQASLVRRRQFANKSCQAEEEQVRPRRLIIISEMIKQ